MNDGESILQPNSVDNTLDFLIRAYYSYTSDWNENNHLKVTSGCNKHFFFSFLICLLYLLKVELFGTNQLLLRDEDAALKFPSYGKRQLI